jgi:hypothetical protein
MDAAEKQEFVQCIALATAKAIREAAPLDDAHEAEHIWLRERIQKERDRAEFYRKTTQAVFGTSIAAFLVWLGSKGMDFIQWLLQQNG